VSLLPNEKPGEPNPADDGVSPHAQTDQSPAYPSPVNVLGNEIAAVTSPYPPWNGWDVLAMVLVFVTAFFGLIFIAVRFTSGATSQQRFDRFASMPELAIGVQAIAELILLGTMFLVVAGRTGNANLWKAVNWCWPPKIWGYVALGFLMQIAVVVAGQFLPFPANTPFDALLKRTNGLIVVGVFSVTLGPLVEELLFRGFLYPLVRKYAGVWPAIIGTALPFGLMHLAQYGYSWASAMLIVVVGIVLASVRERTNSLAASFVVHVAYNGLSVAAMFAVTDGFRHLKT